MTPIYVFLIAYLCFPNLADAHRNSHLPHEDEFNDHERNPLHDQEALFGKDVKRLDEMPPDEGIKQLRIIVQKMDTDNDGSVTPDELRAWLKKVQQRLSLADAKRVWEEHGLKPEQQLTWTLYSTAAVQKDGIYDAEDATEQEQHLARDKIRWDIADDDKDGELNLNESIAFLNPETDPRMHDALAQETMDEMDTNKDGFVDVKEYIDDLWKPSGDEPTEPEWVKGERDDFLNMRDKNKDGKLDLEEIKAWRFSPDFDYIESELQHLFDQCDTDRDMRLTADEVVNRYDLFVGSSVTNYGEILTDHDEL